jgi:tetratricopeptide (TPR) repeat protein
VGETSRIEELQRRVQKDPASIAFAQLAEELRRAGEPEAAVQACRAGLEYHPQYLSARVTLGRALVELGRLDEARSEFEQVLLAAPDNLVALRGMADLHQQRESPPLEPVTPPPLPEWALAEAGVASAAPDLAPPSNEVAPGAIDVTPPPIDLAPTAAGEPALEELESWLAAIEAGRRQPADETDPSK